MTSAIVITLILVTCGLRDSGLLATTQRAQRGVSIRKAWNEPENVGPLDDQSLPSFFFAQFASLREAVFHSPHTRTVNLPIDGRNRQLERHFYHEDRKGTKSTKERRARS